MRKLAEFVSAHIDDDVTRLILNRKKWPDIDMDMAAACIESRRKLKGKVQEWYMEPDLIFPLKLSAEQCSSSTTARYKAELAERIAAADADSSVTEWKIADLTGGFGVDSWFFSKKATEVLYNEMQPILCDAAAYNFDILGATNISIRNMTVTKDEGESLPSNILADFRPDIVYMDPARRGEGGRKVFLIEDCTPDVLTLKNDIFTVSRHILLKLSPMADISMACDRLGKSCREVHVVGASGECKELLIWMDREWDGDYTVKAVELGQDGEKGCFIFKPSEEKASIPYIWDGKNDGYLFEPGKALMKAGAFNSISSRTGMKKIGKSTHYYVNQEKPAESISRLGKTFRIIRISPLDKRSMKEAGKDFPKAEVTARNIPVDSEGLRKKTGVTSGDDAHIFGLKSDILGNLLFITERV